MNAAAFRQAMPDYDPVTCLGAIQNDTVARLPDSHPLLPFMENLVSIDGVVSGGDIQYTILPVEADLKEWRATSAGLPLQSEADALATHEEAKTRTVNAGRRLVQLATAHGLAEVRQDPHRVILGMAELTGLYPQKGDSGQVEAAIPNPQDPASYYHLPIDQLHKAEPEAVQSALVEHFVGMGRLSVAHFCLKSLAMHQRPLADFVPEYYDSLQALLEQDVHGREILAKNLGALSSITTRVQPDHPETLGERFVERVALLNSPRQITTPAGKMTATPDDYLDHRSFCPAEPLPDRLLLQSYAAVHATLVALSELAGRAPPLKAEDMPEYPTEAKDVWKAERPDWLSYNDIRTIQASRAAGDAAPKDSIAELQATLYGLTWAARQRRIANHPGLPELVTDRLGPADPALMPYFKLGWRNLWHPGITN